MEAAAKHARLLRNTGDLEQDVPAVTEIPCHCIVQNCQTQEIFRPTAYFFVKTRQISQNGLNFSHESMY